MLADSLCDQAPPTYTMDIPISRASAFRKRNSTTHSWYSHGGWGSGNSLMSHSCPNPRTLADYMKTSRAAAAAAARTSAVATSVAAAPSWNSCSPRSSLSSSSSPVVIRAKSQSRGFFSSSSSASSPGPTSSLQVPGAEARRGLPAASPSAAYSYDGGFFVTANNPNKDFFVIHPEWVSETETVRNLSRKGDDSARVNSAPAAVTWKSYKRSKSAPPSRFRNPITWTE